MNPLMNWVHLVAAISTLQNLMCTATEEAQASKDVLISKPRLACERHALAPSSTAPKGRRVRARGPADWKGAPLWGNVTAQC
jgi:hypothetical protein